MANTQHPHLPTQHVLRVGLTGGIGCGKNAVAAYLESMGALIIDTDLIAHQITGPNGSAIDRKSTRLNSSHSQQSRMPSSA